MKVPACATVEWKASGGLTSLTYEEKDDAQPRFVVYLAGSSEDDPPIEGDVQTIVEEVQRLVQSKKLGELVIPTVERTLEMLLQTPLPTNRITREQIEEERSRIQEARRSWLINEIENGSYAAIELLKREFGETVKISVEVVS